MAKAKGGIGCMRMKRKSGKGKRTMTPAERKEFLAKWEIEDTKSLISDTKRLVGKAETALEEIEVRSMGLMLDANLDTFIGKIVGIRRRGEPDVPPLAKVEGEAKVNAKRARVMIRRLVGLSNKIDDALDALEDISSLA